MVELLPFQKRFISAVKRPDITSGVLSLPRGNGKSFLAAHIASNFLRTLPRGLEIVLVSGSIEQCRIVFKFIREELGETGYRYLDSSTRCGITTPSGGRLRVQGSNAKTAMGLVGVPLVIADEPGSWETAGGQLLHDAIETAKGKPNSPLRVVYLGTIAPSTHGWWASLVQGGDQPGVYVQALQGNPKKWDSMIEILRVNPLARIDPNFKAQLRAERDMALVDSRLKARFLSYRLNVPTSDESTMLLTVDDWKRVCSRPVLPREGRPIVVGIDLGGGRAWSAAVAVYRSGRVEALAITPGIPGLDEQEKRDRVPSGTYKKLMDLGCLRIAEGLRVQPPAQLIEAVHREWGRPEVIICDRFRLAELQDCVNGTPVQPRVSRWSEAAFDIRALRKSAKDGPFSCAESSRLLLTASLSAAMVKNDDQGNTRLEKRGTNNQARDDVAAALVLASGAYVRSMEKPPSRWRYAGMTG